MAHQDSQLLPLPRGPHRWARGIGLVAAGLATAAALLVLAAAALGFSGQALPLPQAAIARIEAQVNTAVQRSLPASRLDLGGVAISLSRTFAPRLVLRGVKLLNLAGNPVMVLPQLEAVLSWRALASGDLILRRVALQGAQVQVTRDMNGALDIAFAAGAGVDVGQMFALTDQFFASPLGRDLSLIEAQGLSVALTDQRAGMTWALGDGTLRATNAAGQIDVALGLQLRSGAQGSTVAGLGEVDLNLASRLGAGLVDLTAKLDGLSARDVAAAAPALAFMSVLDAPISGALAARITPKGLSALRANLDLGAGALAPSTGAKPIAFQSAQVDLSFDPRAGRILLDDLHIASDTVQVQATGHADLMRADGSVMKGDLAGELPAAFIVQLQLDKARIARPDMFVAPVSFGAGAADLRLRLSPFSLDIGQIALVDGATRIDVKGQIAAQPAGWQNRIDLTVNQISAAKFLGLWPKNLLPGTRKWLDSNLLAAQFSELRLALRQSPGLAPLIDLGYHFDDMKLTPMRSLPAVTDGAGYGAISGKSFSMVLETGRTAPPLGGDLDLSGSMFSIPDIGVFPATGNLVLKSSGSLTATLSLIDQRPFQFLTKSGRAVDFADGTARLTSLISLPLQKIITLPDVDFQVTGRVGGFSSDKLAVGREIAAPELDVFVDKKGLRISGQGQISGVPFDAAYVQDFGAAQVGKSRIEGTAQLSDSALRAFGVALPDGMVTGEGRCEVAISLTRGAAGRMVLTSDLGRIGLQIAPIGYAKPPSQTGKLRAEITLSSPPQVDSLTLQAGPLNAAGQVRLAPNGTLARAEFPNLTIGKWLAADIAFVPRGGGKLALQVTAGTVDLRHFPGARGSSSSGNGRNDGGSLAITARLDKVRVSDGIILTGFHGDFLAANGLKGNFAAQVAGGTPIQGQVSPDRHGTAVRVTAQDAGAALAQAGIYASARGGALDLTLTPQTKSGHYIGEATISRIRVVGTSVLADLLNGISVVGLIDQLGGPGILFGQVSGQFLLTDQGVDLRNGVATGASLGVTLQGVYRFAGRVLDMQGVISPIYLLNGVGALISQHGEGVLGFNYRLRGTADAPKVGVNPLSVLLPGFFRNIFKAPPATLEGAP